MIISSLYNIEQEVTLTGNSSRDNADMLIFKIKMLIESAYQNKNQKFLLERDLLKIIRRFLDVLKNKSAKM